MPENFSWNDLGDELPYEGTRLESVDDIRAAIGAPARPVTQQERATPAPAAAASPMGPPPLPEATPFRPVMRAPMACLCVLDDGKTDGEWIRLRGETFVIGRTEGDLKIPHDRMISGRHMTITREAEAAKGRFRWFINDLQTKNGTFIRAASAVMIHGTEILIGGRRFTFNAAMQGMAALKAAESADNKTGGWGVVNPTDLIPSLTELKPDGTEGQRHFLHENSIEIGRDPKCAVVLDDPMASPKHAKLTKAEDGTWEIHNLSQQNGTWIRKNRMAVTTLGQFQIGEQRFSLRVL
jgi:pSer/pThr/pTyr-binding forkhead associated (FHA) protein